jgi:hypothetical protein
MSATLTIPLTNGWYEIVGTGVCCCWVNGNTLCGHGLTMPVKPMERNEQDNLPPGLKSCPECDRLNDGLWNLAGDQ